jgi:hypothetical protein
MESMLKVSRGAASVGPLALDDQEPRPRPLRPQGTRAGGFFLTREFKKVKPYSRT